MGEPANPTPTERAERRKLAAAIVESVRDDESMPIAVNFEARVGSVREQVEQLAFDLAQEVALLLEDGRRPFVGISVLVVKEAKLLLGKRKGSHGAGEYAAPGGHLEHLESFQTCAKREVLEETGLDIGPLRFLRALNATEYAPKHYVDLAFVAEWTGGEPEVREPDKVERWDWYDIDSLPSPLFAMLPSAIAVLRCEGSGSDDQLCQDAP